MAAPPARGVTVNLMAVLRSGASPATPPHGSVGMARPPVTLGAATVPACGHTHSLAGRRAMRPEACGRVQAALPWASDEEPAQGTQARSGWARDVQKAGVLLLFNPLPTVPLGGAGGASSCASAAVDAAASAHRLRVREDDPRPGRTTLAGGASRSDSCRVREDTLGTLEMPHRALQGMPMAGAARCAPLSRRPTWSSWWATAGFAARCEHRAPKLAHLG